MAEKTNSSQKMGEMVLDQENGEVYRLSIYLKESTDKEDVYQSIYIGYAPVEIILQTLYEIIDDISETSPTTSTIS